MGVDVVGPPSVEVMKTNHKVTIRSREGSVLIASFILVAFIGIVLASFLKLASDNALQAERTFMNNSLFNIAETGVDKAVASIKDRDWSGWTQVDGSMLLVERHTYSLGNGRNGSLRVLVQDPASVEPVIYTEARIGDDPDSARQLRVAVKVSTVKITGLRGVGMVVAQYFKGSGFTGDSYDSSKGAWSRTTGNIGYKMTVACPLGCNCGAPFDFTTLDLKGFVATSGARFTQTAQTKVYGPETPTGVSVDPVRVFTDYKTEWDTIPAAPTYAVGKDSALSVTKATTLSNLVADTQKTYYITDAEVKQTGNSNITINTVPGSVVNLVMTGKWTTTGNGGISVKGGGELRMYVAGETKFGGTSAFAIDARSRVTLWTKGNITFSGNAVLGGWRPAQFTIYGVNSTGNPMNAVYSQLINMGGTPDVTGYLYAPYSRGIWTGNVTWNGACVLHSAISSGNVAFHYDESLFGQAGGDDDAKVAGVTSWEELVRPVDRLDFGAVGATASN